MGCSSRLTGIAMAIGLAGWLPLTFAGTVITSNLPVNTAIVNISGTQDGAGSYNGDQSLWYSPFYTGGATQLLQYTVQRGTYFFRVVNPADAANLFPALTPSQTNQIYTAWTFNSPWLTDYLVFDSAAATNPSLPQLFDGACTNLANNGPFYSSASAAYNAVLANGSYNKIRPGPLGRDSMVFTNTYTFTNAETLIFALPDYYLPDNSGGVSVLITPGTVPVLSILPGTGTATLLWPTNAVGYSLAQTTNLLPAVWSVVTNARGVVNTNFSVTLPMNSTNRFFRLQNP